MFIVVLVFVLGASLFSLDAKFDTLQEWTTECFKNYREYDKKLYDRPSFITVGKYEGEKVLLYENFKSMLNTFSNTIKTHPYNIPAEPYIQKIVVEPGSKICFMGDIHGSLHSLLRNLLRLVALGYLKNDFSIPKNKKFNIVFLGDYVDRGRYSVEVFFTLLKLKLENMDKVFLLRGNHEISNVYGGDSPIGEDLYTGYGFTKEVFDKFKDKHTNAEIKALMQTFDTFCNQLPLALFIGSGDSWIQCNHGGIEPTFKTSDWNIFLAEANSIFSLKDKLYQEPITEVARLFKDQFSETNRDNGFTWCDFDETFFNDILSYNPGRGYMISGPGVTLKDYLIKYNIQAIFRGHQHSFFGLKIGGKTHWENFKEDTFGLPAKAKEKNGFKISAVDYPVFTFSTASEGISLPYDCFGLLTTGETWNDWSLLPYEFELPKDRDGKYIKITTFKKDYKNLEDPIEFEFVTTPAPTPILVEIPAAQAKGGDNQEMALCEPLAKLKESLSDLKTKLQALTVKLGLLKKTLESAAL